MAVGGKKGVIVYSFGVNVYLSGINDRQKEINDFIFGVINYP
jgi:hypothetical protein